MSKSFIKQSTTALLPLVTAMAVVTQVQAAEAPINEVLTDISFTGIERTTADSLYPILPITVGGIVNDDSLAASIDALFSSGYFSDVQAKLNEGRLEFFVVERPVIAEVNLEGNKLIPDEGLEQGLAQAGLAEGDLLNQATLAGVANELQQQYIQQGYYNSDIKVDQTLLEGNRAKIDMEFTEGKPAKVVDINIIGNEYFSDEDIKDALAIKESSWSNWLSKSDRFVQEKLQASLENLKAMYLNEGFVRFNIDHSVINISDDKESVYIELSISEGGQYQFGDVNFLGQQPFDKLELQELVSFRAAEQYDQSQLDGTTSALTTYFGNDGYYYAQIRPVRQINDETRTVDVDFYVDPSRATYVRRINFEGNTRTKDEVLRREMRQLEGALASNDKIQLSRTRLMRTGFFKDVSVNVQPVANQPDQIDITYTVEEQSTGSSTIAAGYSQSGGVTFQLDLDQRNFMGTGNRLNAAFSRSETRESYSLGYTDPYFTKDGISQSVNGYYRKTKYDDKNVSNYVLDSMGASLRYGYPVDENIRVSGGLNVDKTDVTGGRFMAVSNVQQLIEDDGTVKVGANGNYNFKNDYLTYNLLLGWDYSDLDKPVFPTKGMSHSVDMTFGFGDTTYQKAVYKGNIYYPVYEDFVARGYAKLGYGNNLPFFENFYAGGYGSVRGYQASSLGPRSTTFYDTRVPDGYQLEEVGGNALANFGAELILPMPFKGDWAQQIRPVLFVEGGQVFDTTDREKQIFKFSGSEEVPILRQDNEFRYSAGAGMTWYTPIGPISISYSVPFNNQVGDNTEKVQFQIGNIF